MRRYLFHFASLTSVLLLIALCFVWAASYARAYAVAVSRSVWPAHDLCVNRVLSVRLVLGHWVVYWGRYDYDVSVPGGVTFHHAMDVPMFRKHYASGVRWRYSTFKVQLGPQPPISVGGQRIVLNPRPDAYFFQVPLRYGFGTKDEPPKTYYGRTEATHFVVAPAWPAVAALAVLPIWWVVQTRRRRRRAQVGLCPACGYDLRATPEKSGPLFDRCPECGAVATH